MPFSLDYNDVLPKFDELVKQHIVLYVEPKIIYLKQEELDVRILDSPESYVCISSNIASSLNSALVGL